MVGLWRSIRQGHAKGVAGFAFSFLFFLIIGLPFFLCLFACSSVCFALVLYASRGIVIQMIKKKTKDFFFVAVRTVLYFRAQDIFYFLYIMQSSEKDVSWTIL